MKKYYIKIFILILLTLICCKDDFLNDPKPSGSVNSSVIFQSKEAAESLISGILRLTRLTYEKTDSAGLYSIFFARVVKGNDLILGNNWYMFDYENDNREPTYRRTTFNWEFPYSIINQVNLLIDGVSESNFLIQSEKNELLSQAFTLRAFYYFQLSMEFQHTYNYDPGLPAPPIYKKPASEGKQMSSLAEMYNFIIEDLELAVKHSSLERINKSYINRNVAYAVLAQVYQVMGNWEQAENAAKKARENYPLSASEYTKGFNEMSSSCWIWAMPQQLNQSNYFDIAPHSFTDNQSDGYGQAFWNKEFVSLFSESDVRNTFFNIYNQEDENQYNFWSSSKFKFDFTSDIPIIRSAEMYLIEAEAKVRLGKDAEAIELLFELQKNRDSTAMNSGNTGQALIEEILIERRKELYGEIGVEWFDAKRLQRGIYRNGNHRIMNSADLQPNDKKFFLKIPQDEIDANIYIDESINSNR